MRRKIIKFQTELLMHVVFFFFIDYKYKVLHTSFYLKYKNYRDRGCLFHISKFQLISFHNSVIFLKCFIYFLVSVIFHAFKRQI